MGEVPNSILPLEEALHRAFVAGEELLGVCRAAAGSGQCAGGGGFLVAGHFGRAAADADELRVLQATERAHRQRGAEDEERGDAVGELADSWF